MWKWKIFVSCQHISALTSHLSGFLHLWTRLLFFFQSYSITWIISNELAISACCSTYSFPGFGEELNHFEGLDVPEVCQGLCQSDPRCCRFRVTFWGCTLFEAGNLTSYAVGKLGEPIGFLASTNCDDLDNCPYPPPSFTASPTVAPTTTSQIPCPSDPSRK